MENRSVTIVLEWDNAEGLARDKALYFLRQLAATVRQSTAAIPRPVTLLLVFDDGVDQAALRTMLDECADDMEGSLQPKLLHAPDATYYEKKGGAPFFDTSDVLVFADSDCRYSDNWLEDILAPVLSGRVDLAFGDTVALEDGTMMGKMSGLGWFFPFRSPHDPLLKKGPRRFFTVGLTRVTPIDAVPVFLGGLSFVGVTAVSQLIASLTRRPATISTDYSPIVATTRILADEPAAGRTIAA